MALLSVVSGGGAKGPACFLVDTGHVRLMLDLGYGPQPGLRPDVDGIGRVDALLLSHSHRDHAGSLDLRARLGAPPVHATDIVRRRLPSGDTHESLPLRGSAAVAGVTVTTGRSGHAPGGVWLHLDVGGGLLYMGDHCAESALYARDDPPPAEVVILDASYGDDDVTLAERARALDAACDAGPVLLPVPPAGRGPEIALHAARAGRTLGIDDAVRASLRNLAAAERACLRDGIADELARLAEACAAIGQPAGVMLAGVADGTSGTAAALLERWRGEAHPAILFSGYLPPGTPAEALTQSGRARYLRWNVHPRLSDNIRLVRRTGARTVVPAFGDARRHRGTWETAFAPARVQIDGVVSF